MKKHFGILFFFLFSNCLLSQSQAFIREQKNDQIISMKEGILLLPLFKSGDSALVKPNLPSLTKQKFNQEMLGTFKDKYNFSQVLYYYIEDFSQLEDRRDIINSLFDYNFARCDVNADISSFFLAELLLNGYTKNEEIEIYVLKNNQRRRIKRNKEKTNKKQSAFEREMNQFKRDHYEEGLLVKRLIDKEKRITAKRLLVMNFESYFPLHFTLPSDEIILRLANDMQTVLNKKYNQLTN